MTPQRSPRDRSVVQGAAASPLPAAIEPMLAASTAEPFDSDAHLFEVKWDGVRAIAFVDDSVRVQDRYLRDVSGRYPELASLRQRVRAPGTVLDGEIVVLDQAGRADPARLLERLAAPDEDEVRRQAATTPVVFQAFDILYWKGRSVIDHPLERRKRLLEEATRPGAPLGVPGVLKGEGIALFQAAREHDLEGIVAKERESGYLPGQRSAAWLKLKVHQKEEFVIGGFTFGGRPAASRRPRREPFESLLLGLYDEGGGLRYVGEVSGGFTPQAVGALDSLTSEQCPFREQPPARRLTFWCRPQLVASVRFGEWATDRTLRFPVFEGLRPDVPPESCRLEP